MGAHDVVIVGLGPVGSLAALLFAEAGLDVVVFERDEEVYRLPRAVVLDGEIIRAFQPLGLADDVVAMLRPDVGERIGFANSKREWLFGRASRDFGSNGWADASAFHQPEFEGFLRSAALGHPNVTAYIGYEVETFEDASTTASDHSNAMRAGDVTVTARLVGSDDPVDVSAAFMVACDGASSGTRRMLGAAWTSLGYDHDWLVVDAIVKPGNTLGPDTLQVCDPDRLASFIVITDPYRRWEFKLNDGETREEMLEEAKILELIEPWTPPETVEIVRTAVYQFHAAVVDRWRIGRILIAGDAAHQTPPFLGQGMNAGLRDVINLAWKLPLVISGVASPTLLDSYQAERSAHAGDLVEWAVAVGQLMEHLAAVEAAERSGEEPPSEQPGQRLSGYGQGRAAPPLRDGVVVVDQVTNTGSTGYLFAQPIVVDQRGEQFRLDDRLGAGFAIVAPTADDIDLSHDARRIVDQLGIATVVLDGLTPVRGRFDDLFSESSAVIVRPDRYVFGHTAEGVTLDDLVADLHAQLHLTSIG
ncbi:MAG: bifunctional 3-(3-hydroxy-phenyl)propionate/3-hydroxycinnamic acid hydroxylase [Ilumatobacter sp.]